MVQWLTSIGRRWLHVAESIGDRVVNWRPRQPPPPSRIDVPHIPRPRPTLWVTAVVPRIRSYLASLDDDWYAARIKACIGLDILALICVAGIICVAIAIELIAYCLIDQFGFVIGILALIAMVVCAVGVVAFYFATTSREEPDDLEF